MGRAQSFAQNPREDPCFFEEHFQTNLHRFGPIWTSLDKFRPIIKKKLAYHLFAMECAQGFAQYSREDPWFLEERLCVFCKQSAGQFELL